MLHYLAGAIVQVANLVNYNAHLHPKDDGKKSGAILHVLFTI